MISYELLSYVYEKEKPTFFDKYVCFGDGFVSVGLNTPFYYKFKDDGCTAKFVLIGVAVSCIEDETHLDGSDIINGLLMQSNSLSKFLSLTEDLAGCFVLFFELNDEYFVINDAAGYAGIYYHDSFDLIASDPKYIAKKISVEPNIDSIDILDSNISTNKVLPNDLTLYENVKICLPNRYYNLSKGAVCNLPESLFVLSSEQLTDDEVVELIYKKVNSVTKAYSSRFKILCPLTAGWDSRLVFAFFNNSVENLECFTFSDNSSGNSDVDIARQICQSLDVPHATLDRGLDAKIDYEYDYDSYYSICLAKSLTDFEERPCIVNGDIVDQIGGALIANNLHAGFVNSDYLVCKMHSFSSLSKRHIDEWIDSSPARYSIGIADLFAWENRLARWAHNTHRIYSQLGVLNLNIFNSRSIIKLLLKIDKGKRNRNYIHKELLKRLKPSLLDIPFNPQKRYSFVKKIGIFFLIATYIKFYVGKFRFYMSNKK